MSYLIKVIGLDEDTRQEVSSQLYCMTSEEYNDLLHRINDLFLAWVEEKNPGIFRFHKPPIGTESTPGTPVVSKLKEASDGE